MTALGFALLYLGLTVGTFASAAGDNRRINSVLGALVADAASMPLHWIYNDTERLELLASRNLSATPEFFPVHSCPYYIAPPGKTQYILALP